MVHGLETIRKLDDKETRRLANRAVREQAGPNVPWYQRRNTPWTLGELRSVEGKPEYEVYRQFAVPGYKAIDPAIRAAGPAVEGRRN